MKYPFKPHWIIAIKKEWLIVRKNAESCKNAQFQVLSHFRTGALQVFTIQKPFPSETLQTMKTAT